MLTRESPRMTPEVKVIRLASPAVVFIEATRVVGYFDSFSGWQTRTAVVSGSGVVIEKSGYIVTNNHILTGNPKSVTVQFGPDAEEKTYPAEIVGQVPSEDLALLKINGSGDFPVVTMGTSSDLMIGERVVVIGNPYRQRLSASAGMISGLHRNLELEDLKFPDLIQTDASINPGNSGGPVLNVLGEMIGMATVVNQAAENMGFAIPIDRIKEVLEDELLAPASAKSYLGIELKEDSLVVARLTPKSPADEIGVHVGDRIVALNGERVSDAKDYNLKRLPLLPATPIRLTLAREGREFDESIRAWTKVDGILWERMGLTVDRVVVGNVAFVSVRAICPGGPAEKLGLKNEDVLEALREGEKQPVYASSPHALAGWVSALKPGTQLSIDILRDDNKDRKLNRTEERYKGVLTLR